MFLLFGKWSLGNDCSPDVSGCRVCTRCPRQSPWKAKLWSQISWNEIPISFFLVSSIWVNYFIISSSSFFVCKMERIVLPTSHYFYEDGVVGTKPCNWLLTHFRIKSKLTAITSRLEYYFPCLEWIFPFHLSIPFPPSTHSSNINKYRFWAPALGQAWYHYLFTVCLLL